MQTCTCDIAAPDAACEPALALAAGRPARRHAAGEIIFHEEEPAEALLILTEGTAKFTRLRADGSEAVLCLLGPGVALACCGERPGHRHGFTAEAVTPCRVVAIPAAEIAARLRAEPGFAAVLLRFQQRLMAELAWQVEHLTLLNNAQRLAAFVLRLAVHEGDSARLHLPCGKALLARLLGMTPASLSRAIGRLRTLGVSVAGRRIQVASATQLRSFCDA